MGQKNKEKRCRSVLAWKPKPERYSTQMGQGDGLLGELLLRWLNGSSLPFCSANICPWDKMKKTVRDVPKSLKAETAAKISKCLVGWTLQVRRLQRTHRC